MIVMSGRPSEVAISRVVRTSCDFSAGERVTASPFVPAITTTVCQLGLYRKFEVYILPSRPDVTRNSMCFF